MRRSRASVAVVSAALAVLLTGCGVSIPNDPDGTLESVRGGMLRAGVTPNDGFVDVTGSEPVGTDVDRLVAFAASVDATVEWTVGSEEALVRDLEAGDLDVVAGGLTDQTPWLDQAGVSRPYAEVTDDGTTRRLVMLVPMGENAFLSELETFLSHFETQAATR